MKYIRLVNRKNNRVKEIKMGVSWVYLFFGGWALLFSGRWIFIGIEIALNVAIALLGVGLPLTAIYHVFLFFFGNKSYAHYLVSKGWEPDSDTDAAML